jgi:prepilin-type processing-associated H-X9-DG protein
VVIAIIAILAAILFPVFTKVREKARQSACMNNQRQLAIAIMLYAQDNDETLPLPSEWVSATNMSTDPKIFNCPSVSHAGRPSDPDYGMNAFLYDRGPGGSIEGVALGQIDNPDKIELTIDIKGATPDSSGNPALDAVRNPFPKSFTAPTYSSSGNADKRHTGASVVSYLDGHVAMPTGLDIGGMTGYSIPAGFGRFYADFSEIDAADFATVMGLMWNTTYSTGYAYNAASNTCDVTGKLVTDGAQTTMTSVMGPMTTKYFTVMIEGEVSDGTSVKVAQQQLMIPAATAPAGDDLEKWRWQCAFDLDTANDYIQFGQLRGWTNNTNYPVDPGYPVGAWWDLPPAQRGERAPISASTSSVRIETSICWNNLMPGFPTAPDAYWQVNNVDIYAYATTTVIQGSHTTNMILNGTEYYSHSGPVLTLGYDNLGHGRMIVVSGGTLKIKKLMVSAAN